jgi:23S rRNA-/tRNA-specific pseudouridylate synthase
MHHAHLDDRMTVLLKPENRSKWRWEPIFKKTSVRVIDYDIPQNKTLVHITIDAGARHQIRAHLWALWYPIIWEELYTKRKDHKHMPLHLWSVGCELKKDEDIL